MKFGDIFAVLVVLLVLYYVAMIAMDIYKEKLKKLSEKEKDSEVDIDISDEAGTFTPIQVSRDDIKPVIQNRQESVQQPKEASDKQEESRNSSEQKETVKPDSPVGNEKSAEADKFDEPKKSDHGYDPKSWEIPQSVIDEHRGKTDDDEYSSAGEKETESGETENGTESEPLLNVRITYREPCMTNGMPVEDLIRLSNKISNDGTADLQDIVMKCEAA